MSQHQLETSLPRKISFRLIPILIMAYVLAHLDRGNISFAALTMNEDLNLSASAFGFGAGVFYLGYLLFQVPINLLLQRFGARRLITIMMIVWGVLSTSLAFIQSENSLYSLRFFLGIAESGLYPGVMLYITYWYPPKNRAGAIALFGLAIVIGGLLGGPLAGFILDNFDGLAGLAGWRWLFIIEGAPSIFLALIVLWRLDDQPQQANWLTDSEKAWLKENQPENKTIALSLKESLSQLGEGRIWLLAAIYMLFLGTLSGFLFWIPRMLQASHSGLDNTDIGLLVGACHIPFAFVMIFWGKRSDRLGERFQHVLMVSALMAIGLIAFLSSSSLTSNIIALCCFMAGAGGVLSTVWGMVTDVLGPRLAAVGIAVVNSGGALGSFASVSLIGVLRDRTGSHTLGIELLFVCVLLSMTCIVLASKRYKIVHS